MAKSRIEGEIPGIGNITVTGNLATEDAIQDLIAAVQEQAKSQKVKTQDFQDNLDDATNSLDEFDDEISRATKAQNKLARQAIDLAKNTASTSAGFLRTTANTNSMSDIVESAGDVLAGFAGGLAGMIPVIGEGTARLAEATVMAGTALLSMAVGAVESFQEMNRSIMQGGLILQGGFSGLADAADLAGIPVNEFGNAVLANINRLRLLEGGAPGGLARISGGFRALQEAQEENLDTLYALGFSQQQVVSGMADVALGAQRAGRNLNNEDLAAGTFDYLKNLQELSRLTGESAESIQAQVEANRSNLFVQNALLDVAPQYRDAAAQFAAAIPASLAPMRDFIVTGQSFSTESGLMVSQMGTFAELYRQAYEGVSTGQLTEEQARSQLAESLAANRTQIEAELQSMTQTFGLAPDQAYADMLGAMGFTAQQMIQAGAAFDPLANTGNEAANNLSITIGALQGASEAARAAIQSTFIEGLDQLSGDSGALTRFAEATSGAAMGVETFRDAMLKAMQGDVEGAANALGIPTQIMPEGGMRPEDRTLDPSEYQNPLEQLPGYDPNMLPGAATGNILTGPETGYLAELHGTEAVVPLPDGRSIPVDITGSNSTRAGNQEALFSNFAKDIIGDYASRNTQLLEGLSIDTLANEIRQMSSEMQVKNNIDDEAQTNVVQDFSTSLDSSRTLSEMLQVNKNMLSQMMSNVQKTDSLIRAMENANLIARNSAYVRA